MSKLLINETPLQFLPTLALALGGERPAIALQQLHYMLVTPRMSEERAGRRWVRASYAQWQEEAFLCWSVQTVRRIFGELREAGVVLYAQLELERGDATGYMSIDYDKLESLPHVSLTDTCHVSVSVVGHVSPTDTSTYSKKKKKDTEGEEEGEDVQRLQPNSANLAAAPNAPKRGGRYAKRQAATPPQTPITDALLSHFAVSAHREIISVLLDGFACGQIIDRVTDETKWRAVLIDYRLHRKWSLDNLAAQLDRYEKWDETQAVNVARTAALNQRGSNAEPAGFAGLRAVLHV